MQQQLMGRQYRSDQAPRWTQVIANGVRQRVQALEMKSTMQQQLMGRQYRADQAPRWTQVIANGVRQRVQDLEMKRYK
ncbi:putative dynein light chain Tctex-type [Operophtera brumata]|uniref:Putative dynein light chain Tctex-type n=1 Tax=Operophtera brumata TaxID=104452 RepID=A0A0L7KXA0_OPEBR|nr:putative dynein light chain Tctex-type [Operophtera brumata]